MQLNFQTPHDSLTDWLRQHDWIASDDRVLHLEKPGEGNMNMVVRVVTRQQRLILKQANPFVQKYPSIPAPTERVAVEAAFYRLISERPSARQFLPKFIGFDAENRILAVEDLGESADYTFIYKKENALTEEEVRQAATFLSTLHAQSFGTQIAQFPDNLALRRLNHEHLFHFPYLLENGFDLDSVQPGLQAVSLRFKTDEALKTALRPLGERYLGTGTTLLHGDFYPGSWLRSAAFGGQSRLWVIDPEFCFFGPAEYDFGVFFAHLLLAQSSGEVLRAAGEAYQTSRIFDEKLAAQFAGMEMLRRIIGLAQLPLDLDLDERTDLLEHAREMILTPAAVLLKKHALLSSKI